MLIGVGIAVLVVAVLGTVMLWKRKKGKEENNRVTFFYFSFFYFLGYYNQEC